MNGQHGESAGCLLAPLPQQGQGHFQPVRSGPLNWRVQLFGEPRDIQTTTAVQMSPRDKSVATLDLNRYGAPLRGQIRQLLRGEFLAGATNICLIGRPGTGKSHVMAAIARALIEKNHPVLFTSVSTLVEKLLDAKRNLRLARELKRLDSFDCLALDDIGYVQHDRAEMEVLFALLAERYERKSVMITSNLVFSKWDQIFKDPMTTAAAIDRVVHHAVVLEFTGPSLRAEAAAQRAARVKHDSSNGESP